MKRILVVVVVALFVMSFVSIAMAQEAETDTETSASMVEQKEGMMEMGKMKGKMKDKMMRHGKNKSWDKMSMMKQMMQKQIVATQDGGIVVLTGNKLIKYDRNLNLKKEVEIPMDMKGMHKKMMQMMKECPMKKMQESVEGESQGAGEE